MGGTVGILLLNGLLYGTIGGLDKMKKHEF